MLKIREWLFWGAAIVWTGAFALPASLWFDAGQLTVKEWRGEETEILFSGGPVGNFAGSYSVIIEDATTQAIVAEDRSAVFQYQTGRARPPHIDLAWWAPGLPDLPPGAYVMETCWTIHRPLGFFPVTNKTTCVTSNIFEVTE